MRLTPVSDRVLVKLDPFEETFGASTLVRPDIAKDKPQWGEALATGRKVTTVNPGERVFVPWATGADFKISGRLHVFVRERDILAVEA